MSANIIEPLISLSIEISKLTPDPVNARKHNDKNLKAIKGSLERFGQRKPVVVQDTGKALIVKAGNGTLEAAKALGWDRIAAVVVKEDAVTASAFALADNRTAELAEWDMETLGEQLQALYEDGYDIGDIGFDPKDVGMGVGEAQLPDIEDAPEPECQQMTFTLHRDQVVVVQEALAAVKASKDIEYPGNENSNGNALYYIVSAYANG